MNVEVMLVFVGVFAVVALIAIASNAASADRTKQASANLISALATQGAEPASSVLSFRKSELLSTIPWLNRRLAKTDLVPRIRSLLEQAHVHWTVGKFLLTSAVCFAVPAFVAEARLDSLLVALLVGLLFGATPLAYVWVKRSRRLGKFEQGLPDALDLMVGALRVGHSFSAALGLVTRECVDPIGSEFRICFDEQNYGDFRRSLFESELQLPPSVNLEEVRVPPCSPMRCATPVLR